MSHTFSNLLTHIVFSTKERRDLIEEEFENELHAYLGGLIRESEGKAYIVGGTSNHVHLLVSLPPKIRLSDAVRFIKSNSTNFVKAKFNRRLFAWQIGFGAFSVSKSNVPQVVEYIKNQKEHHRKISFQEEFVQFLRKNGVEYDERWLWK